MRHKSWALALACVMNISFLTECGGGPSGSTPPPPPPAICELGCATTFRYDNTRQGVNAQETLLRASTLASSGFKFQNSAVVDGQIYAQPLYLSGLPTSFASSGNAVFVATEHGSVYALDGSSLANIVSRSLLPSGDTSVPVSDLPLDNTGVPCSTISFELGITATPVIDPAPPSTTHDPVMFAVVTSKHTSDGSFHQTLNAWDPVANTNTAFDIATALGSNFNALVQNQRAGLALTHDPGTNDAIIYVAWGSHCDSTALGAYNGWLAAFRYDYAASQFSLVDSFTVEPETGAGLGGIWMAGAAPAIDDSTGNIYLVTGNGNFLAGQQFGHSVLQLHQDLAAKTLKVIGSYTPNKWAVLNDGGTVTIPPPNSGVVTLPGDEDLGSGGAVLAHPGGQTMNGAFEVIAIGKEGVAYVVDPTLMNLGLQGADPVDPCSPITQPTTQCFAGITLPPGGDGVILRSSGGRGDLAFWAGDHAKGLDENLLFAAGSNDTQLRYWQIDPTAKNGTFNTMLYAAGQAPVHSGTNQFPYPGASPVVSWDDTGSNPVATDAIVWVLDTGTYLAGQPAILLAYPALPAKGSTNVAPIFTDSRNGPVAVKFMAPVVVNGEVYVAGQQPTHVCAALGDTSCPGMLARFSQ
jgi:hypothetical protein